jgi:hypothetical protein
MKAVRLGYLEQQPLTVRRESGVLHRSFFREATRSTA